MTVGIVQLAIDGEVAAKVVETETDWDALRSDWDALYARSGSTSTALDFTWLRNWWRVYQSSLHRAVLQIVTVWRTGCLIGAVPLYADRSGGVAFGIRRLRMLSTGEAEFEETCADYLTMLCLPGDEPLCARAAWDAIGSMKWDHLEFLNLVDDTPLLRAGSSPIAVRAFALGTCPVADLSGGFEQYLQKLSSNTRQQVRRLMREGERAGVTFEMVRGEHVGAAFEDLIRLHQHRWVAEGKPGAFAAPRFAQFHRSLVEQWAPPGRAVVARLSLASEAVAVLYGFVTEGKFDFYQSGVRTGNTGLRSPGNLSHLLLMRALVERGVTAYDFLQGAASYKRRLATRENRLVGIEAWRPNARTAAYRLMRMIGRRTKAALRRIICRLRRRLRTPSVPS